MRFSLKLTVIKMCITFLMLIGIMESYCSCYSGKCLKIQLKNLTYIGNVM